MGGLKGRTRYQVGRKVCDQQLEITKTFKKGTDYSSSRPSCQQEQGEGASVRDHQNWKDEKHCLVLILGYNN